MKFLLDPKLGAKLRLLLKVVTLAAVIVAAIAGSFPQLAWTATAGAALATIIGVLTHLTEIGNTEP